MNKKNKIYKILVPITLILQCDYNLSNLGGNVDSAIIIISNEHDHISSIGSGYTSSNLVWSSKAGFDYKIKTGTSCRDGTLLSEGIVPNGNETTQILATSILLGENIIRICVTKEGVTAEKTLVINRIDDSTGPILNPLQLTEPENLATSVNPSPGEIVVYFAESLETSTPVLTMEICNAIDCTTTPTWQAVASTNTDFSWSQTSTANDTLTIKLSWILFPENAMIRWTLDLSSIKDLLGNTMLANLQQTFTTTVRNTVWPLAHTGQTSCWKNNGAVEDLNCDDGDYVFGDAMKPAGADAYFPNYPNVRSFIDNNDGTIKDNVTTLLWTKCSIKDDGTVAANGLLTEQLNDHTANCGISHDDLGAGTWEEAINSCSFLNQLSFAGRSNWRLPNYLEIYTHFHYQYTIPAVDHALFPNTGYFNPPYAPGYWTSTALVTDNTKSTYGNTYQGRHWYDLKTTPQSVRCVSESVPPSRSRGYVDYGETILDQGTSLRWRKCITGQTGVSCFGGPAIENWVARLNSCKVLNDTAYAGLTTWRLPSVIELASLLDLTQTANQINPLFYLPIATPLRFVSSTTSIAVPTDVFDSNFSTEGTGNMNTRTATSFYSRCVASEP